MSDYRVITPSGRPTALKVLGTEVTVLASAAQNGCYGITYQSGAQGSGPPPHCHPWDEAFFVLSGEIRFLCGDQTYVCAPGTLVDVPRNTVHAFTYGAGGGSMLELTSRESQSAEMFTEVDAEIDPVRPDLEKAVAVLERNGVTVPR